MPNSIHSPGQQDVGNAILVQRQGPGVDPVFSADGIVPGQEVISPDGNLGKHLQHGFRDDEKFRFGQLIKRNPLHEYTARRQTFTGSLKMLQGIKAACSPAVNHKQVGIDNVEFFTGGGQVMPAVIGYHPATGILEQPVGVVAEMLAGGGNYLRHQLAGNNPLQIISGRPQALRFYTCERFDDLYASTISKNPNPNCGLLTNA